MSDTPSSIEIDRYRMEFERGLAETRKFMAEQTKLQAEARKFDRDRHLIWVAAIGGIAGLLAAAITAAKAVGALH